MPQADGRICLQAYNGQLVASEAWPYLLVNANRGLCQDWEKYHFEDANGGKLMDGDTIYIKTHHKLYWSAQPSGTLEANREKKLEWERFQINKVQ